MRAATKIKIPSVFLVVLLVLACANPVAALDRQFDDADEDSDISTPNTVIWVADPACTPGNPFGACAFAPAVVVAAPALGQGTYIVLAATGAVIAMVQVSSHSPSSSLDVMEAWFKDAVHRGLNYMQESGTFVWSTVVHQQHQKIDIYIPGSEEYHLLHKQLDQLERDYNDAKNKGIPTKNNKDQIGHGIDNEAEDIVPYMSVSLFHNKIDKQNGCPKQIRYYGKDGKAEMDIDFWHGGNPGGHSFPHRHAWRHDLIARGITDTKLTRPDAELGELFKKLWETNKCKNYDYEHHRFKKGDSFKKSDL